MLLLLSVRFYFNKSKIAEFAIFLRSADIGFLGDLSFNLAICLPKVCSAKNASKTFLNIQNLDNEFEELFCRLPNDKPWVAGDYVAM